MREIILPEIEKEVNEGQNFAQLRQIYQSLILATWFKKTLKESLLGQVYVDRNKVKGVDTDDPALKQKIYDQYVKAFEQGVYNYIKEEVDPVTNQVVPRQYFSGGLGLGEMSRTQRSVRKIELSGSRRGAAARAMRPAGDDVVRMGTNLVENLGKGDQEDLQEQALARRGSTDGRRDKAMLVEKTVTVLEKVAPQALADVRAGLFTPEQMAALDLVVEVGQEHTVALAWQAAGDDAAKKKAYLDQVALRNQTYPTGLKGYVVTHRQKLADKKAEKNPYAGMRLRLTQKVDNSRVDEKYWAAMDRGIEEAGDMVIMLAQGGVGDRLAWKTERKIKTDLTMDPILDMSYMERFIRDILAIQEAANERREAKGLAPVQIPYVHMVSGQTAAGLQQYLTDNENFGMDGMSFIDVSAGEKAVYDTESKKVVIRSKDGQTRALGQLVLFKQEDVFAANNWEGNWVMNPVPTAQEIDKAKKEGKTIEPKTHLVMEKAHNHGDLNMLMHMSGLARAYANAGKKHIMYHQDTNAETFRAAVPGLGNMVAQGKKLNIVVVPIKLGEKAGSVVYMVDEKGKGFVRNVEYSDIQQVLSDPKVREDLEEQGLKPEQFTDGNINVFLMDLETYADILEAKNGLLGEEIVNPKADTLVSRLEAMVQDAYIDFDPADVMVNSFDSRFVFDAAKNSVRNALIAVAGGLFPENTTVAIAHNQRNNRVLLKENTGVEMNVDAGEALALPGEYKVQTWKARGEKKVFVVGWDGDAFPEADGWAWTDQKVVKGIPYPTGAHVSWTPDWARTADEVREKWQGGRIDDEATVGIKGKNIFFRNVQVEGSSTLIVKANPDQTLTVENLKVNNNGWRYRMLTREEALDKESGFSEFERMWGFRVLKDEQMVIDLTSLPAGNYRVNEKGEVASVDAAMLARKGYINITLNPDRSGLKEGEYEIVITDSRDKGDQREEERDIVQFKGSISDLLTRLRQALPLIMELDPDRNNPLLVQEVLSSFDEREIPAQPLSLTQIKKVLDEIPALLRAFDLSAADERAEEGEEVGTQLEQLDTGRSIINHLFWIWEGIRHGSISKKSRDELKTIIAELKEGIQKRETGDNLLDAGEDFFIDLMDYIEQDLRQEDKAMLAEVEKRLQGVDELIKSFIETDARLSTYDVQQAQDFKDDLDVALSDARGALVQADNVLERELYISPAAKRRLSVMLIRLSQLRAVTSLIAAKDSGMYFSADYDQVNVVKAFAKALLEKVNRMPVMMTGEAQRAVIDLQAAIVASIAADFEGWNQMALEARKSFLVGFIGLADSAAEALDVVSGQLDKTKVLARTVQKQMGKDLDALAAHVEAVRKQLNKDTDVEDADLISSLREQLAAVAKAGREIRQKIAEKKPVDEAMLVNQVIELYKQSYGLNEPWVPRAIRALLRVKETVPETAYPLKHAAQILFHAFAGASSFSEKNAMLMLLPAVLAYEYQIEDLNAFNHLKEAVDLYAKEEFDAAEAALTGIRGVDQAKARQMLDMAQEIFNRAPKVTERQQQVIAMWVLAAGRSRFPPFASFVSANASEDDELAPVIGMLELAQDSAMLTFRVDSDLRAELKAAGKNTGAIQDLMEREGLYEKVKGVQAIASVLMHEKGDVLLSQGTLYKGDDVVSVDRVFGIIGYMENPVLYLNRAKSLAVLYGEAPVTESMEVGDGGPAGATVDSAMMTSRRPVDIEGTRKVGGIDLNPALLDLKIKRDGNGIPLPMPQQSIQELMEIEGFLPVIINVTPIQNLPMLLGLEDEGDGNKEETIAKLSFYRKVDVYEYKFVVREEESAG